MDRGIDTWAALQFRRELNRAVMKFKEEHPGVLEARTAARFRAENEKKAAKNAESIIQNQ